MSEASRTELLIAVIARLLDGVRHVDERHWRSEPAHGIRRGVTRPPKIVATVLIFAVAHAPLPSCCETPRRLILPGTMETPQPGTAAYRRTASLMIVDLAC